MKNCSGINCPMQYGVVDAATCPAVECCPNATPTFTNYDRIIYKSPEELAEWIAGSVLNLTGAMMKMATEAWLDWLKEEGEAKEGE